MWIKLKIPFEQSNNISETITWIHEAASVSALETLAHLPSLSERINLSAKKGHSIWKNICLKVILLFVIFPQTISSFQAWFAVFHLVNYNSLTWAYPCCPWCLYNNIPKKEGIKKSGTLQLSWWLRTGKGLYYISYIIKASWILGQKSQVKDLLIMKKPEALAEDVMTQTTELLSRFQSQGPSWSTPSQQGHTKPQSIKSKDLIMRDSGNNLRKKNVQMQNNVWR